MEDTTNKIAAAIITPEAKADEIKAEEQPFFSLAQSAESNKIIRGISDKITKSAQLDLYGNGTIPGRDFIMHIRELAKMRSGINRSAPLLLDSLLIAATEDGLRNTLITLPLKEYMRMRGLNNVKEARIQANEDLDVLQRIHFEIPIKRGRGRGSTIKVHIFGGTTGLPDETMEPEHMIRKGIIIFRFNEDFYNILRIDGEKYLFMPLPSEGMKGNLQHYPYKFWFCRTIAEHKRMNIGKLNEDVIGVETITKNCPGFPTTAKHIIRDIIDPFERDLNALENAFTWEYTGDQPFTNDAFINSSIHIYWKNYPDISKLEAGKKRRTRQTAKSRADKKKISQLEKRVAELEKENTD
jgi:hypothetical protein